MGNTSGIIHTLSLDSRHHTKTGIEQKHGYNILTQMSLNSKKDVIILAGCDIAASVMTENNHQDKNSFDTSGVAFGKVFFLIKIISRADGYPGKNDRNQKKEKVIHRLFSIIRL